MTSAQPDGLAAPPIRETPGALAALWAAWREQRGAEVHERLFEHFRPFAHALAARCYRRRFSSELEFADYAQFATVGLLEAMERFDPAPGVPFEAFAAQRIMGAVLDGVESLSEKQRQIATRASIRRERAASLHDGNTAETTPLQRLADIAIGLAIGFMLEDAPLYVDGDLADPAATPYGRLETAQLRRRVLALVDELPDTERRVIRHHYLQQIPFDQIARSCGLTKGRISQIHRAALERLRHACADNGAAIVT